MALVGVIIVVAGFLTLIRVFGLVERSTRVLEIAQSAVSVVFDKNMNDLEKEKAMQTYAKELLFLFFLITAASILALTIPFGVIWLLELAQLLTVNDVIDVTLSWEFIVTTAVLSIIFLWFTGRKKPAQNFESQHSETDKLLHNLAFSSWSSQVTLSNLETRTFKKSIASINGKKPAFITALPRAGTTLLLELCASTDEFATHTYADMPFLLTPLFWGRFSKLFRKTGQAQERVHGDRILVNVDSPEAFEEIIWKGFWPSHYKQDQITPWIQSKDPSFEQFIAEHIRKIILLRGGKEPATVRYISKNNLNIARINYLKQVFPDAIIIIPFRDPLQHASSLLRQHRNFLKIHREDEFARKYMEDTGHFDFGMNLRPVNFSNWLSNTAVPDPTTLTFWVTYWIQTYQYLLTTAQDQATFFSYDSFCQNPKQGLQQLGQLLGIKDLESFLRNAGRIQPPKPYDVDVSQLDQELLQQAQALFQNLQAHQVR